MLMKNTPTFKESEFVKEMCHFISIKWIKFGSLDLELDHDDTE